MSKVVVLIPCYNEEITIEKVISDFKRELPEAQIYVYDNNSTDATAEIAMKHGAIVKKEIVQGKGNVVRSMFRDIDADVYVLVDGDDTYPAESVHQLIGPVILNSADMVVGDRLSNGTYYGENKRNFHDLGNNLVRDLINHIFNSNITDIMTGYRVFSKAFVKNMPVMSSGFQIETEMTIFSLVYRFKIEQVPIVYRDRPSGSESKLNTFSDGFRVLVTIFDLCRSYKPLMFFSFLSVISLVLGLVAGIPTIAEFVATGMINKIPSAILASSLVVISFIVFMQGMVLDAIKNQHLRDFEHRMNLWHSQQKHF